MKNYLIENKQKISLYVWGLYFILFMLSIPVISSFEIYPIFIAQLSTLLVSFIFSTIIALMFYIFLHSKLKYIFNISLVVNGILLINLITYVLIDLCRNIFNGLSDYITRFSLNITFTNMIDIVLSIITIAISISVPLVIIMINNKNRYTEMKKIEESKQKTYFRLLKNSNGCDELYNLRISIFSDDAKFAKYKNQEFTIYLQNISRNIIRVNVNDFRANISNEWITVIDLIQERITNIILKENDLIKIIFSINIGEKSNLKYPDFKVLFNSLNILNQESYFEIECKSKIFSIKETKK